MLFLTITLLGSAINAPGPPPPPPPAPPCTLEMLKARPAGDKNWPIKCSGATLGEPWEDSGTGYGYKTDPSGEYKSLDLSEYSMSYGEFVGATFFGWGAINFAGSNLHHANMSGAKLTADWHWNALGTPGVDDWYALIDFTGANLVDADLSDWELTIDSTYYGGYGIIDFTGANLANADLGGSKLTTRRHSLFFGKSTINFTGANLTNANTQMGQLSLNFVL